MTALMATKNRSVIAEHERQRLGPASRIWFGST
jgi:hypothetical protein